jgi:hypothetical protein
MKNDIVGDPKKHPWQSQIIDVFLLECWRQTPSIAMFVLACSQDQIYRSQEAQIIVATDDKALEVLHILLSCKHGSESA